MCGFFRKKKQDSFPNLEFIPALHFVSHHGSEVVDLLVEELLDSIRYSAMAREGLHRGNLQTGGKCVKEDITNEMMVDGPGRGC